MSQRKALIASIAITLILALSAIGIRAAMLDSTRDNGSGATQTAVVSAETSAGPNAFGGDRYDDENELDHDEDDGWFRGDDDDSRDDGDHDDEDDDDD